VGFSSAYADWAPNQCPCRRNGTIDILTRVYHSARAVRLATVRLGRRGLLIQPPVAYTNNTDDGLEVKELLFHSLSDECKNFTTMMSIKHQLQNFWFQDLVLEENYNATLISDQLLLILENVQELASALDDLALSLQRRRCLKLTTHQYKMMYYVLFDNEPILWKLFYLTRYYIFY